MPNDRGSFDFVNPLDASYHGTNEDRARFQNLVVDGSLCDIFDLLSTRLDKTTTFVSERSLKSNVFIFIKHQFEKNQLSAIDYELLKKKSYRFFDLLLTAFNLKPLFIYLMSSPEDLYSRIQERGRYEERSLTLNDLRVSCDVHEALYEKLHADYQNNLTVDMNQFKCKNGRVNVESVCDYIMKFI